MKLPKKLKIGSLTYRIEEVKELKTSRGISAYGRHIYDDKLIQIDKDLDYDVKILVVLHEVLHGIMCCQEIELEAKEEEHVVRNMTKGIASFLQDNPAFIKQLMRKQ